MQNCGDRQEPIFRATNEQPRIRRTLGVWNLVFVTALLTASADGALQSGAGHAVIVQHLALRGAGFGPGSLRVSTSSWEPPTAPSL